MPNTKLTLSVLKEKLAVCRLRTDSIMPDWAKTGNFFSVTKTGDELSVVCEERQVPEGVKIEAGWRAFKIEGPLDFSLTGILASIAMPLAEAGISIFAISTYDTDYVLVKEKDLPKAQETLARFFTINF